MKNKANKLFDSAVEKLKEAKEELVRPKEDAVSYLVCKNAQYAIENFLRGYMLKNGIDPSNYNTIDDLYEQCTKINKKFKEVDLSDFSCKGNALDSRYCNELSKVSNCFDTADNLDTFFRREKIIS